MARIQEFTAKDAKATGKIHHGDSEKSKTISPQINADEREIKEKVQPRMGANSRVHRKGDENCGKGSEKQ